MGSDSEGNFAGLFDDVDVNRNKLSPTVAKRNANLVKLIGGVAGMGLNRKENAIDAFGDACEYPMGMYASNAGKSGGEFFYPAGGVRAFDPDRGGGKDGGQQGV